MHKNKKEPVTKPIIDDLKRKPVDPPNAPKFVEDPPKPSELDQDAGGGYNPDHTIPQP
jgi:hypothetical protein